MAKHLDLLANPSIHFKNKKIVENLINNYLPSLDYKHDGDVSVFSESIKAVKMLLGKRYKLIPAEIDKSIIEYFNTASKTTEDSTITIHEPGMKDDIKAYLNKNRIRIGKKDYPDDAPYVKKKCGDLPKKCPRLD